MLRDSKRKRVFLCMYVVRLKKEKGVPVYVCCETQKGKGCSCVCMLWDASLDAFHNMTLSSCTVLQRVAVCCETRFTTWRFQVESVSQHESDSQHEASDSQHEASDSQHEASDSQHEANMKQAIRNMKQAYTNMKAIGNASMCTYVHVKRDLHRSKKTHIGQTRMLWDSIMVWDSSVLTDGSEE